MQQEIVSTSEIAEAEWDGESEPGDVRSDIVATKDAEGRGIEFHVSMRDYTLRDMEELIIEAAARTIVGRHNDATLAKAIEAKAIEKIAEKADKALASVTSEIIDQPITPKYGFLKPEQPPVTMREFIGLTGREYLTAFVDHSGNPTTDRHYGRTRIQHLVEKYMERAFKLEIEKATNAAVRDVQAAIKANHDALLAAETARFKEALAKTAGAA